MRTVLISGGVGITPQIQQLSQGAEIVVATPGRLLDHVGQRTVDLSQIETLILDEADRMLDMGFIHDIRRVIALLPKQRQNLMFSATFSPDIRKLAEGLLNRSEEHTSELQSLMRISYAVFCLKKKKNKTTN